MEQGKPGWKMWSSHWHLQHVDSLWFYTTVELLGGGDGYENMAKYFSSKDIPNARKARQTSGVYVWLCLWVCPECEGVQGTWHGQTLYLQACGCVSLCPCLGLSGSECLPRNLSSAGCVWVPFWKGLGGGAGSNFAFPLVEINQSWESELLAVKTPGGGGLMKKERGTKVKREDDWLQGKRNITACRPRTLTINCGGRPRHPFPRL